MGFAIRSRCSGDCIMQGVLFWMMCLAIIGGFGAFLENYVLGEVCRLLADFKKIPQKM